MFDKQGNFKIHYHNNCLNLLRPSDHISIHKQPWVTTCTTITKL